MVPDSTRAASSGAISPLNLLPGNPTMMYSTGPIGLTSLCVGFLNLSRTATHRISRTLRHLEHGTEDSAPPTSDNSRVTAVQNPGSSATTTETA